jgi:hypothetical protein
LARAWIESEDRTEVITNFAMSAAALAKRCQAFGAQGLNRDTIANLETGRRERLSVDELAVIALALNVSPIHLLADPDDSGEVSITPKYDVGPRRLRGWLASRAALQPQDWRYFEETAAVFLGDLPDADQAIRGLALEARKERQSVLPPIKDESELEKLEEERDENLLRMIMTDTFDEDDDAEH